MHLWPNEVGVGWLCCPGVAWDPIRETSSYATRQETLGHSRLSSLSHCGLTLAWCVELARASWSPLKKKEKKSSRWGWGIDSAKKNTHKKNTPFLPKSSYAGKSHRRHHSCNDFSVVMNNHTTRLTRPVQTGCNITFTDYTSVDVSVPRIMSTIFWCRLWLLTFTRANKALDRLSEWRQWVARFFSVACTI